jgi:hypothetical protein
MKARPPIKGVRRHFGKAPAAQLAGLDFAEPHDVWAVGEPDHAEVALCHGISTQPMPSPEMRDAFA